MAEQKYDTIEEIVSSTLVFKGESNGWFRTYCEVCGDGSRTKGPRGGWRFDGEMCFYHCFNQGCEGNFDPNREIPYSKDMNKIFLAFGIPKDPINTILFKKKLERGTPLVKQKRESKTANPIAVPDHFYKLCDAEPDDVIAIKAKDYLITERFIDPSEYPFYLSTGISKSTNPKDISLAKSLRNRIIIPSFKREQMVYWIARSLDKNSKLRYLNLDIPKGNIIYGFDRLYAATRAPLFICEGFFDAFHVNGVAVLENSMTKDQIDLIDRSPRTKIVIPDKHGDSKRLAEQALDKGWSISLPDIGSCTDISKGIAKYGKLYVIDSIVKNIQYGRSARLSLKKY